MFYYDKQGKPLDMMEWAELKQDEAYSRIDVTELPNGQVVSTVWLGLNVNISFLPGDETHLHTFETMLFPECEIFARVGTEEDAKAAHRQAVIKYSNRKEKTNQDADE